MSSYDQVTEGEWIFPRRKGYKYMCCGCGLVHRVNLRIRDHHIEWQWFIDKRATGQARRHRKPAAQAAPQKDAA